ncbi:MAG: cupin domain-containing protein [Gemmataceae bacterium]
MSVADDIIAKLGLQPHPKEGGYFCETYRSHEGFTKQQLPERYSSSRSANTAIFYLLTPTTCSALHKLNTDEIFHFYAGSPVRMLQLHPDGSGKEILIGPDVLGGQSPQVVVPRDVWQGSFLEEGGEYCLLGCTVAPGFDFADYEDGDRETLTAKYPKFEELIKRLTPMT